eukprot:715992-Prymnesium_polylepis.1
MSSAQASQVVSADAPSPSPPLSPHQRCDPHRSPATAPPRPGPVSYSSATPVSYSSSYSSS